MAKLTQLFHEPGTLISDFVVDWSEDNRIAVSTQNSVCIYEVKCKPHEKDLTAAGVFAKIMPHKEQNLCFEKDLPFMEMSRENNFNNTDIFTDAVIMSITTKNDSFTGFRRALWSPAGVAPDDSCLLATLSWDRRLNIYQLVTAKPQLVASVSDLWVRQHAKLDDTVTNMDQVRQRAYELAIIDMVWTGVAAPAVGSGSGAGAPCCHLVTVTRSGHMAVWRVSEQGRTVSCACRWRVMEPADRVTALTWLQPGYLLIGRHSGRLQGYRVDLSDDVTTSDPWLLLDDTDNLPVSHVLPMEAADESHFCVLLVKGFVVVAVEGSVSADRHQANVTDTAFIRLEGAQITGLCRTADGGALASTLYNQFWTVGLSGGGHTDRPLALCSAPISVLMEPVHYSCHAVATSPSRTLICTVERVFDYYDHLVVREPVRVSFTLLERRLDTLLNAAISSSLPLHRLTDVLEAARLTMLVDRTPIATMDGEDVAEMPVRHLQFQLFMVSASLVSVTELDRVRQLEGHAEMLRCQLVRAHLAAVLERPLPEPGTTSKVAAFRQRAEKLVQSRDAQLAPLIPDMPPCGVCQTSVSELSSREARCLSGHRLPVCCLTLALCDSVPYRRCRQCGAFAVTDTVTLSSYEMGPWCTFCDGRLLSTH